MDQNELLQKYRKNNIEMACALNDQKMIINGMNEDVLRLQQALQNANKRRSTLEFELELRTNENKQLREQLFDRDHKLAVWRGIFIDLFRSTTGKFTEIMQAIGVLPMPKPQEAAVPIDDKKSIGKSHANIDLVKISLPSKNPIERVDDFTDLIGQPPKKPSSIGPVRKQTPQNQAEEDLIRFSKSPKIELEKIKVSSKGMENVTVRRPTKSITIDESQYGNESQHEEPNLIVAINESLELLEELSRSSVLYPKIEIIKNETETTFSDESITESFSMMQITKDSGIQDSVKQSSHEAKKPIKSLNSEVIAQKTEGKNGSSGGSTTPTIVISKSANVSKASKRKSDENYLRIPKKPQTTKKLQSNSPKTSKIPSISAFNSKSPRLSMSFRESLSSNSPSSGNKCLSTNLSNIVEKSPAKSPMKCTINSQNMQKNTISSGKSPMKTPSKKISKENIPMDCEVPVKKHSSNSNVVGIDDLVGFHRRRMRRAAPTDLREPLLNLKMRRKY